MGRLQQCMLAVFFITKVSKLDNAQRRYAGTASLSENLEHERGEDFEIGYRSGNRFRYMGNGLTTREIEGEDLSFYLKK